MHPDAYSFCASIVEKTDPFRDTPLWALDVGGANVNGTARELWPRANWVVLDKEIGDDVDIVADITTDEGMTDFDKDMIKLFDRDPVLLPNERFDLVLCTEVLEHEKHWVGVVDFCVEMMGNNGHLVLTCAGPNRQPHRPDGTHLPPWDVIPTLTLDQSNSEISVWKTTEDTPYYANIMPNALIRYLTECGGFAFRSFIYNPAVGDIYVYGTKLY